MAELDNGELERLKHLEESLWKDSTRFDRDYMMKILSPDFVEFGCSGRKYTREETLSVLRRAINAKLPLKDLRVHAIRTGVVLVTYISEVDSGEPQTTNRSSIWIKEDEEWQIVFHQGTPLKT